LQFLAEAGVILFGKLPLKLDLSGVGNHTQTDRHHVIDIIKGNSQPPNCLIFLATQHERQSTTLAPTVFPAAFSDPTTDAFTLSLRIPPLTNASRFIRGKIRAALARASCAVGA